MEQTVKEGTVIQEKVSELSIDSKDAVAVMDIYQFKGHVGNTFHGIFIAAGGTETVFAAERDKLKFSTVGTSIHGAAKGRIAAVYHLIDIFHLSLSGMKGIFNFLIMINKDFLWNIHKIIMHEKVTKGNP